MREKHNAMCVDASVLIKWFVLEEGEEAAARLWKRFLEGAELWLPESWSLDVASVLAGKVEAGLMSGEEADELLRQAMGLPAGVVPPGAVVRRALYMAEELGVSVSEAVYLAVAEHGETEFYTADRELYERVRERFAAARLVEW